MQEQLDPPALDTQNSAVPQRLLSQSSVLDVLTQLAEQLGALGDEDRAPPWREPLLTTIQQRMTKTHAELQETRAALAQLGEREGHA